jgi:hypothetical protein
MGFPICELFIMLFGGHGTNDDRWDGGNGGSIELIAGGGHGRSTDTDTGGDVSIAGGASAYSKGGSLLIKSGPSLESSSGNVTIATDNSARLGVSGTVNISTGLARWGDSGNILMSTGAAEKYGHGGNIQLEVGNTEDGDGGNITVIAEPSSAMFCKSGKTTFRHHIIGLLTLSLVLVYLCSDWRFSQSPRRRGEAQICPRWK